MFEYFNLLALIFMTIIDIQITYLTPVRPLQSCDFTVHTLNITVNTAYNWYTIFCILLLC